METLLVLIRMEGGSGSVVIYLRNLSHFDRKGAMRSHGDVFSASFSCTDWEISFRRWANGKNSQLKKTPRQHGHSLDFQLSQTWTE